MTAVTSDMQGEMNVFYDEVLLKYQDEPLSEDEKTMEVLKKRLNELHYVRPLPEDDGVDVPEAFKKVDLSLTSFFDLS